MFALVDCNSFFASCQQVFAPWLWHTPVAVLSNNDGCIVARTRELKNLGVPMGAPHFKWKDFLAQKNAAIFSANFALYGDMSARVMTTLATFDDAMEIYSIDEAFLAIQAPAGQTLAQYGQTIRQRVKQWTGIPVSVGIAPTKTLAKMANELAKREPALRGVFDLSAEANRDAVLASFSVGDIWGVGRQYAKKLHGLGIATAYDLIQQDDAWIQKNLTIMGLRMVKELRGESCIVLEDKKSPRKGIVCSRSFGKPVHEQRSVQEAVSHFMHRAAEKLRDDNSMAGWVQVFLRGKLANRQPYSVSLGHALEQPTAYTPRLAQVADMLVQRLYKSGRDYRKVGVWLGNIQPDYAQQSQLFFDQRYTKKERSVMQAVDNCNQAWGNQTVYFGNMLGQKRWRSRQSYRSPCFTTRWKEIPVAHV